MPKKRFAVDKRKANLPSSAGYAHAAPQQCCPGDVDTTITTMLGVSQVVFSGDHGVATRGMAERGTAFCCGGGFGCGGHILLII